LINFIQGKDVFVNMPTGSGKYWFTFSKYIWIAFNLYIKY
jgi:hypothetical protein